MVPEAGEAVPPLWAPIPLGASKAEEDRWQGPEHSAGDPASQDLTLLAVGQEASLDGIILGSPGATEGKKAPTGLHLASSLLLSTSVCCSNNKTLQNKQK